MSKEQPWTETAIDVIALYCPEDSKALAELRADAQALADVRTLDEYARKHANPACDPADWITSWFVAFQGVPIGDAKTPDEARAKAAAWVREQAKGAPECTRENCDCKLGLRD